MPGGRAEPGGNEDHAGLAAVQRGGVRLAAGPGLQDTGGRGVLVLDLVRLVPVRPVLITMPVRMVRGLVLAGPARGPRVGRPAGPAVRLIRCCGVLAQHVGQGGPHAQDQDREAGHEGGDAPRCPGDVVLVHQVKRDLPGHAERERADR